MGWRESSGEHTGPKLPLPLTMSLAAPAPDPNQVRVRLDLSAPSRRGELSFAVNGGEPVLALPLQRRALVYIPRISVPHGKPLRAMSPTSASRDRA